MSDSNLKILLVDDDPALIEMHTALLEQKGFSVLVAEDGEQAMSILDVYHENIGVVVSDISMPKMDGYELCTRMKAADKSGNIPLIFVSAHTGLDEKMKGYAVGADDYIPKPVNEDELSKKIAVLLEMRAQQVLLNRQAVESQNVAMQAMTFSSELGLVIDFYNKALNAKDYTEVARHYFETVADFGLISVMQIYTPQRVLNLGERGIVSPLEANVIELARDKGRFFDFGARTIVNFSNFSLLVKNMPLNDKEKYGRIKDIMGMLCNGLEAKFAQLNNEQIAQKKTSILFSIKESISNIEQLFSDLEKENITAIEDMNEQMHEALMCLGLTEAQGKANIQNITDACLDRANTAFYKGVNISENLRNIFQHFQYVTGGGPER